MCERAPRQASNRARGRWSHPAPRPSSAGTGTRGGTPGLPRASAIWGKLARVKFEVEVYENEARDWVATAVVYGVTATGRTEKEALVRVMEALARHLKKSPGA